MPILTKEVEVRPSGKMIRYYKDMGYSVKYHEPLLIKIKDLQCGSCERVEVLCDMCKVNTMLVKYKDYNKVVKNTGSYVCKECSQKKCVQTNLKRYGVEVPSQSKKVIDKMRETNLKRYGVKNYSQTEECQNKMIETIKAKYGTKHYSQTQEYKEKFHNTCIKKYGADYRNIFAHKSFDSYYKNTGYIYPFKSTEVKEKVSRTLYKNGTTPTSRQQLYIFNLYSQNENVYLNYPISYYNADICFPEEKLDIEVDFGGHNLSVKTGRLTQEEFNQKEIIRNNIIKREGYKQMRIISSRDFLPSDQVLLQMLSDARKYFSDYPEHSWIEFNIDLSIMRNAEHKIGISYDYGKLRLIKEIA